MPAKKNILFISRTKVEAYVVSGKKIKKSLVFSAEFSSDQITPTLTQAVAKIGTKNVRILLADELAYTYQLTIPANTEVDKIRPSVFQKLQLQVPENLTESLWDFKIIKKNPSEYQILAFAPVVAFFQALSSVLASLNAQVELIEPEAAAKLRRTDSVLATAQIQSLKGKDEQVLTLKLLPPEQREEESETTSTTQQVTPSKNKRVLLLLSLFSLAVFISTITTMYLLLR